MVAQAEVDRTNGAENSPPRAMARNTGELLSDAMTLAELQSKLLLVDVKHDLRQLIAPLALIVIGALLVLAALPIALSAVALALDSGTDLQLWAAFAVTFAGAILIAGGMVGGGVWYLLHRLSFLARSRSEWDQNVRWFKNLLRRLGSGPRPGRTDGNVT